MQLTDLFIKIYCRNRHTTCSS